MGGFHGAIVRQTIVIIRNLSCKDFAARQSFTVASARALNFPGNPARHEIRFRIGELTVVG
jgi:hypothetical protein